MATKTKQKGFKSDVLNTEGTTLLDLCKANPQIGSMLVDPKEFKSGKVGLFAGGSQGVQTIKVNGRSYKAQVGLNIVCHHSDEWPADRPAEAPAPAKGASK